MTAIMVDAVGVRRLGAKSWLPEQLVGSCSWRSGLSRLGETCKSAWCHLVASGSAQHVAGFPGCVYVILFHFLLVTRDGYPVKTWMGLATMSECFTGVSLVPSLFAEWYQSGLALALSCLYWL